MDKNKHVAPLPAGGRRRRRRTPACNNNNPTAPRKRRRRASSCGTADPVPSSQAATAWVFPVELLLEIVARSDTRTLLRCAAVCKTLRRDILSAAFLRRVTGQENLADRIVPPYLLGYLHTYDEAKEDLPPALFSMVHPDPAIAAASFVAGEHLAPFISRNAADLLGAYRLITSRGGLVVLERRNINRRKRSERRSDMCVYNPMTGKRTFFPYPPGFWRHYHLHLGDVFALLTAEDGIGCGAFMLLAADLSGFRDCSCIIDVQTMSSDVVGTWSPTKYVGDVIRPWAYLERWREPVVLRGGLIHWLANCFCEILTYDVATSKPGSVKLPFSTARGAVGRLISADKLHLGKSPDGRLRLLVANLGFIISVWLLSTDGTRWELDSVIDIEEKLRSLDLEITLPLEFKSSGENSGVALLQIHNRDRSIVILDVETGEMRKIADPYRNSLVVEVDLHSRLQTMKAFL